MSSTDFESISSFSDTAPRIRRPLRMGEGESGRATYQRIKRLVDIVLCLLVGTAALLVVALASVAIMIAMGRPIFFCAQRVGRNGRTFQMIKLRTMRADNAQRMTATLKDDPRITPFGKWLRQSHIDELPQLWNIFVGDMTLIGPRPEQPHLVDHYREQIPNYDLRHVVTPGLSGWSQVCFGYAADVAETAKKLSYDIEYIDRFGPKIDLLIIWKTLSVYLNPNYVR
jgi:lipopolysaccharide/colanic/teichoic acid biosynthesis glycosyltransferase